MKKWICVLLALVTVLATGCAAGTDETEPSAETRPVGTPLASLSFGEEKNITSEELADMVEIMNISPYSGIYLEGGPMLKTREENLYAIKITNTSDKTIANITLVYNDGTQDLNFYAEMIPAGQSIYVVEKEMKFFASAELTYVSGVITYLENAVENMDAVEITPTRNSTLMVKNITKEELACVVIYYRKVVEDGTLLGGPVYSAVCEEIMPDDEYEAEAECWQNSSCKVINVLIYNSVEDLPLTEETTIPGETAPTDNNG